MEFLAYAPAVKRTCAGKRRSKTGFSCLTALSKPDGGVRGIVTGDVFRLLVSRALATGWATTFDRATSPYQFALQARALLRCQAGLHAGAWLTAIPAEPATTSFPQAMQLALQRRLRLPLPLLSN